MSFVIPVPQVYEEKGEKCLLKFPLKLGWGKMPDVSEAVLHSVCPGAFYVTNDASDVEFIKGDMRPQGFEIQAESNRLTVIYGDSSGGFYALAALWCIYKSGGFGSCFRLRSCPNIEKRGFMLDISRGKVPTLEALKSLADILARFGYNQLFLYIEGFSYLYPSFSQMGSEASALTPEEIGELSRYCRERFIALAPCCNTLGHMSPWLAQKELSHLAECPDGFSYGGFTLPPTTLDPLNPHSRRLVKTAVGDLLQGFSPQMLHMGLDEPFELGKGVNKGKNPKSLLLNYMDFLREIAADSSTEMMVWTDALHKHNCIGDELPRDVTYMEWGYEKEFPFDERCASLREQKLDFYVCPGTSSWLSFTGMTDNALENIDSALAAALKYSARGVLLTDWGDGNHMQPLSVSYAPIVYCAAKAWNGEASFSRKELITALNLFVFEDDAELMGKISIESGSYYLREEFPMPCKTLAHLCYSGRVKSYEDYCKNLAITKLLIGAMAHPKVAAAYDFSMPQISGDCIEAVINHLEGLKDELNHTRLKCPRGEVIVNEYEAAISLALLFTRVRGSLDSIESLRGLKEAAKEAENAVIKAWTAGNKISSLDKGLEPVRELQGV